jgi:Uncharacterised nucleotidyltransferase
MSGSNRFTTDWPERGAVIIQSLALNLILRPEESFLLGAVKAQVNPESSAKNTEVTNIDWDYFARLAEQHGVLPLIYKHVTHSQNTIPSSLLDKFRHYVQLNVGSSYVLARRLLEILSLFEKNDLSAFAFKGPSLAMIAYQDLSLRPFSDLDIFVPKKDVLRARSLLEARGFTLTYPTADKDAPLWVHSHYHYTFVKDDGDLVVEIHWGIAPRFLVPPLDEPSWWQQQQQVKLLNTSVPRFSPEDQLLLLCIHGSRHQWERLIWICDIALLVKHEPIDWSRLLARAQTLRCERMVYLGLLLAHQLLAAPLPEVLALRIHHDRTVSQLAATVHKQLFSSEAAHRAAAPSFFWQLQMRWRDKARLLVHLLRGKFGVMTEETDHSKAT